MAEFHLRLADPGVNHCLCYAGDDYHANPFNHHDDNTGGTYMDEP